MSLAYRREAWMTLQSIGRQWTSSSQARSRGTTWTRTYKSIRKVRPCDLRPFFAVFPAGALERCLKGLGAGSEDKREPASDINTGAVDGLKVLDPDGPSREADITVEKGASRPSAPAGRQLIFH